MSHYQFGVSVRVQAYNHAPYIKQALDSILAQQTTFAVEVVVGDDFSTDNTLEIVKQYKSTEKFSIKVLERHKGDSYHAKRLELGRLYNFANTLENCTGKYVALLDGDDYWIDNQKLQSQYNFMEEHEDFVMCFTDGRMVSDDGEVIGYFRERFRRRYERDVFSYDDVCQLKVLAATAGYFFRNNKKWNIPDWFYKVYGGDSALLLILSSHGLIKYLKSESIAYRVNSQSVERNYDDNKLKAKRNVSEDLVYFMVIKGRNQKFPAQRLAWNYFYLSYRHLQSFEIFEFCKALFSSIRFKIFQVKFL